MLCQRCQKKQATVHLTRIVNGQKTELYLCEECAREREDLGVFTPFSIADLFAGFMDMAGYAGPVEKSDINKCKNCGMTYERFKKIGRLGCGECYKLFASELSSILKRVQGGFQHTGKVPKRAGADLRIKRRIDQLKAQLRRAVETEAYEEAAKLRDKIRELEKGIRPNP